MLPAQRLRMKPRTRLPRPGLPEGPQSRRAQNPVPGAAIARVKTPERQGLARRGGNAAAASAPVARARLADPTMTTPSLNPNVASAPDVPAPNQVTLAANGEDPSGSIEGNFAAGLDFDTDDWGSDSESTERFTGDPGTDSHVNNYHTPNVNSYHIPRAMFQGESDNYYNTNPSNLSTDAINNTTNLGYGGYPDNPRTPRNSSDVVCSAVQAGRVFSRTAQVTPTATTTAPASTTTGPQWLACTASRADQHSRSRTTGVPFAVRSSACRPSRHSSAT